jgi:hypothetical protein
LKGFYHGSRNGIEERLSTISPKRWIHLGTQEQASHFYSTGVVERISFSPSKVAIATTDCNWDYPLEALNAISSNVFPATEEKYWELLERIKKLGVEGGRELLASELSSLGYEAIAYPNEVEGQGTSYTTWKPEIIRKINDNDLKS